jgi:putative membrane protein
MRSNRVPIACLVTFVVAWALLAINPRYPEDWLLENLPTFLLVPLVVISYRRFRLSDRAYIQATLFALLHTIGSHYTYSEVPLGDWIRDAFDLSRNHYDRFVHFSFGVLMLLPLRELAMRNGARLGRFATAYLSLSLVALWSGLYEIIEWITASLADPEAGTAYLGTQGDVWDAQKDMILALGGAMVGSVIEEIRAKRAERRANI